MNGVAVLGARINLLVANTATSTIDEAWTVFFAPMKPPHNGMCQEGVLPRNFFAVPSKTSVAAHVPSGLLLQTGYQQG